MNMQLVVQTSKTTFPVQYSGKSFRMGRNADCDLTLVDCAVVSSHHARMDYDDQGWTLSDLASKNGTYINGKRIQAPQRLKTGDTIHLGSNGPAVQIVEMQSSAASPNAQPQSINRTALAGPPPQAATVLHPHALQPAIEMPPPIGHDGAIMQPAYQPAPAAQAPSPTRLMLRQVLAGQKRSWVVNLIAGCAMVAVILGISLCFAFDWHPFQSDNAADQPVTQKKNDANKNNPPKENENPKVKNTPPGNPPVQQPKAGKKMAEEQIFEHGLRSACTISLESNNLFGMGKETLGAGTLFNKEKGLILVNHHIVRNVSGRVKVYFPRYNPDGEPIMERQQYRDNRWFVMGRVVAVDPSVDLAVVQVENVPDSSKAVRLANAGPKTGQNIHAVGANPIYAGNAMWGYTDGDVKSVVRERPRVMPNVHAKVIRSDMLAKQVLDGTGIFNDRGELIGVDFATDQGVSNRMHIDISDVRRFLQSKGYLSD